MRTRIVAFAALLVLGFVAFDAAAAQVGVDDLLFGSASASCIEDGITGRCHSLCPPVQPPGTVCTL